MKNLVFSFMFFGILFGANAQDMEYVKILLPHDFKAAIAEENVQLIDVRSTTEYYDGHIGNAINLDYTKAALFVEGLEKLDIGKPVYIYSQSGTQSQKAASKLIEMGFEEIYDLRGGYTVWKLSGYAK